MPERWQNELKKLRREQMPDGLRERAESGPRREVPPDRRQRIVAGVVAFAVFIGAGAFAWRAFDGGDVPGSLPTLAPTVPVVLEVDSNGGDPTAFLSFEQATQPGLRSAIEWCGEGEGCVASEVASPELPMAPRLAVRAGSVLALRGDADSVEVQASAVRHPGGQIASIAMGDRLDAPGRYLWQVHATWDEGSADFRFTVEVVGQSEAVTIHLLDQSSGPVGLISSGDQTHQGFRESYGWCNEGGCSGADPDYSYTPAGGDFLPVVPGAPFLTEGSGELTRLVVRTFHGGPTVISDTDGVGVTTPAEPGRYTVWMSARWGEQGHGTFVFAIEVQPAVDEIPDVLHLTCRPDLAKLDGDVVRAQADGVHIAIDASEEVRYAEVIMPSGMSGFGVDERSDGSEGIWADPGDWFIGCPGDRGGLGPSDVGSESLAPFTVVDPDDHYAETDLSCEDRSTSQGVTSLPMTGSPPPSDAVADSLVGLGATDVVREGGYGSAERFKLGPTYVAQRNGDTIATIRLGSAPDDPLTTWAATIETCFGSGITVAPPEQDAPPDVLHVTCSETERVVVDPIVSAQADGVHVVVDYPATDTFILEIEIPSGGSSVWDLPTDQTHAETVLASLVPGRSRVACARFDGLIEFAPEDWVPLEIVDAGGAFVSAQLDCADEDQRTLPDAPVEVQQPDAAEVLIRSTLSGIAASDEVEPAGYRESVRIGDRWTWRVVRDGAVIARVDVGPQGGGYLRATVCSGSGIRGN